MQDHRIFVAINFPKQIREQLFELNSRWNDLPFRFTHFNDIHITLVFIGTVDEEYLLKALDALELVKEQCEPFVIQLTDIILAPTLKNIKYIWLNTDAPLPLLNLYKKITHVLRDAGVRFSTDHYPYRPHITLGRRLKGGDFGAEYFPQNQVLHESLNMAVSISSFEVMESFLSKRGAQYQTLRSYKIGS